MPIWDEPYLGWEEEKKKMDERREQIQAERAEKKARLAAEAAGEDSAAEVPAEDEDDDDGAVVVPVKRGHRGLVAAACTVLVAAGAAGLFFLSQGLQNAPVGGFDIPSSVPLPSSVSESGSEAPASSSGSVIPPPASSSRTPLAAPSVDVSAAPVPGGGLQGSFSSSQSNRPNPGSQSQSSVSGGSSGQGYRPGQSQGQTGGQGWTQGGQTVYPNGSTGNNGWTGGSDGTWDGFGKPGFRPSDDDDNNGSSSGGSSSNGGNYGSVTYSDQLTYDRTLGTLTMVFQNPLDSGADMVLTVTSEGKEIYRSGLLPVGYGLSTVACADPGLSDGVYPCQMVVSHYDRQTGEMSIFELSIDATLTVRASATGSGTVG